MQNFSSFAYGRLSKIILVATPPPTHCRTAPNPREPPLTTPLTPLLTADSPLDARARDVIAALFSREQQLMADLPTDDPRDPKRLRRVKLTHGEMFGQPEAIRTTWLREAGAITATAQALKNQRIDRVVLTGCGDSLAVMIGARLLLEACLGVPCEPVQALDLAYFQYRTLGPGTLVVALSSSGATTRTVEALLMAKAQGAMTLALSNTPGSALMQEAGHTLLIHAERRGWPTQSSTAAMALLCRLAAEIGHLGKMSGAPALLAALDRLPDTMADILAACDAPVARMASRYADRGIYLFAGGGPAYAASLFGAVKMKECSPDHAISIPLEEFHHYNSQKPGDPLFLLAPAGPTVSRARDTAEEGRRWRGAILSVVNEGETALDCVSDEVLRLPTLPESLAAFTFTLPLQLFAYHTAMTKFRRAGADTDA
jgi:glucosamine--fructose-6-phosphate aminotransferase (isomerizing)